MHGSIIMLNSMKEVIYKYVQVLEAVGDNTKEIEKLLEPSLNKLKM